MHRAKIFTNGQSQAVRLPKKFKFNSKEVSVIQLGNAIVLQALPKSWKQIFSEMSLTPSEDFMKERQDLPPQERDGFK